MKAIVLSAVQSDRPSMTVLAETVDAELQRAGYDNRTTFDLTTIKLAFCQGEFDCWVKTPGLCRAHDAETEIVAAVHDADALVLLGPVTFGGHGYTAKRAIDRLLCLLEPFFTKRLSLTHHATRYDHPPRLFSIGCTHPVTAEVVATYDALNDANAINFLAPSCGAIVLDDTNTASWGERVREMLARPRTPGATITGREPLSSALLAAAAPTVEGRGPSSIARAALLVGSAKVKGTSASEAITRALCKRLDAAGVATEIHFATEFVHDDTRAAASAQAIAQCDLFVLVTPLYVDSFPALATHALELVARARAKLVRPASFVTVVNCGFPEPEQNRTALRIARHFADEAGYAWGGGLALGGGGVIAPDRPLDQPHGPAAGVVRALDFAASALARSGIVPKEAIEAMASAVLPDAVYRLIGDLGWRWQAHKNGLAQRELRARPLDQPT